MKAVLRLPDDQAPELVMEEGRRKADIYCQGLCFSLPTAEQRFDKLGETYRMFTDIHIRGIENFYSDEYFARGNHKNDKQSTDMILLAYKSAGSMARVVDHMHAEAYKSPSLIGQCMAYQHLQGRVECNLRDAFNVYATKGAVLKPSFAYARHIASDVVAAIAQRLRHGAKPA